MRSRLPTGLTMVVACAPLVSGAALARPAPIYSTEYGQRYATITHAGNRDANETEAPFFQFVQGRTFGAVDHQYRVATTEVTAGQWLEFVRAYAPHVSATDRQRAEFMGGYTNYTGLGPGGVPTYSMDPQHTDKPGVMGWRYAARYTNWLHNAKGASREAFEQGAYDTSTFTNLPGGLVNDQALPSPGARFWIPSIDEVTKATFYDPDRYGVGQEGYWFRTNGQDEPLVPGAPGTPGAQTSAGWYGLAPDVGSYALISGPWGLFDTSGGADEWAGSYSGLGLVQRERFVRGSTSGDTGWATADRIDILGTDTPYTGLHGLRLAAIVPTPAAGITILAPFVALGARRRRIACGFLMASRSCLRSQ